MTEEAEIVLGPPPPEPVRKVRADAVERAERIWAMRIGGASWRQAAEAVGLANGPNAMRVVRSVYGEVPQVDRAELQHLWRERLELLWRVAMKDAVDRKQGATIAAVKVAALAAHLDGLAPPQRVDVGVVAVLADVERLMQEEGL